MRKLLLIMLVLLLPSLAEATHYYISPTGSDSNNVGALDDFGGGNVTATRRAIPPILFQ